MDDLTKKFDSFELLMTQATDKLSSLETWRTSTEDATGRLLAHSERIESRLLRLKSAPPPAALPRPQTAPPQPPSRWVNPFDLNMAPQQATRPSASASERPSGHGNVNGHQDDGGGILGVHPPCPVTGMPPDPPPSTDSDSDGIGRAIRSNHVPKLKFPVFDGTNPRLWVDRCEMYFELYPVTESLKTRLAALNFTGVAASWLQTYELRGRVTSWTTLCKAVCDRFDRDQYQTFLRQLDSLKQTGSVTEYY